MTTAKSAIADIVGYVVDEADKRVSREDETAQLAADHFRRFEYRSDYFAWSCAWNETNKIGAVYDLDDKTKVEDDT